jgi:hypothetical protein
MQYHRTTFTPPGVKGHARVASLFLVAAISLATLSIEAASPRVVITPATGYTIVWDGNNGGFFSPDAGAGPGDNVALASHGTVPFTSSDLGPLLSIPFHVAANLNDGLYGNAHSWISANGVGGTSDPAPFAALRFAESVNVSSIAWGRDNGDAAERPEPFTDRTLGTYTLQFTAVESPDETTVETDDAATGWASIGTVQYLAGTESAEFTSYLRHRFDVAEAGQPISATGLRIKVSDGGIAIDEIEVNPLPDPVPPISNFIEITPAPGFAIAWDRNEGLFSTPDSPAPAPENDASATRGATAFGSSELDFGVHFIGNVNDGLYGNAHSWIPDFAGNPDPAPFIGIDFGRRLLVRNIAWGRDNGDVAGDCCGGTLTDRALGVYVLQVTIAPNPDAATPEACGPAPEGGWVTIGTIHYKSDDPAHFNSYLRHRFDVTQNGAPIPATGIRILVPANTTAIDEIEVNGNLAIEQDAVQIVSAPEVSITWDGNDGHFNDPAAGAAPPANRALASEGTIPFASSDLGPVLSIPFHVAANLNDGLYGNAHSWISANGVGGTSDPDPFVGLNFGALIAITNIAWGRDNGDGAERPEPFTDRALDTYRLQYTTVEAPDASTPDTEDAATGWQDLGTVTYTKAAPPFFTPYLRHRFDLAAGSAPIEATGIRIKVANGNTAIDEIEVNTATEAPAAPGPVALAPAPGYELAWDGNDGHYNNPAVDAAPPANRALASQGTTAFTSSELGEALELPFHRAVNLNDGVYGNANSWIPNFVAGDATPFAGLNFNGTVEIANIAWSRDNGNVAGDCCGGTLTDRVLGLYTLQITMTGNPDASTFETGDASTGWETVGTIEYRRAEPPDFNPHLRHRFELSYGGGPILATGLRILVPNAESAIDEIEVNTVTMPPVPQLSVTKAAGGAVITWSGGGGLEWAPEVTGPWICIPDALATGYTVDSVAGTMRFYRVRR